MEHTPFPAAAEAAGAAAARQRRQNRSLSKERPLPNRNGKGGQGKRGCQTVNKPICACNGVSADSALSSNTALLAGRAAPQNCWRKSCRIAQKFIPVRTCTTFKLYVQVCTGTNGNISVMNHHVLSNCHVPVIDSHRPWKVSTCTYSNILFEKFICWYVPVRTDMYHHAKKSTKYVLVCTIG